MIRAGCWTDRCGVDCADTLSSMVVDYVAVTDWLDITGMSPRPHDHTKSLLETPALLSSFHVIMYKLSDVLHDSLKPVTRLQHG